jgi:hypothetical protein
MLETPEKTTPADDAITVEFATETPKQPAGESVCVA